MIVKGRATAKSASFILISKVLSFVINGFGLILIARILAPSAYGIYVVAMAMAGFFSIFGDFGIGQTLAKLSSEYIAKKDMKRANGAVGGGLVILIALPGTLAILTIILSGPIAQYLLGNPGYTFPLQLAAVAAFATVIYGSLYSALIGFGMAKRIAQTTFIQAIMQAAISIGLALLGFGALAPMYGISISFGIGFLIFLYVLILECGIRPGTSFLNMKNIRGVFNFSAPLGISGAAHTIVMNIAIVALGIIATTQIVGNFGIATRVSGTFDIIVGTITLSLLPLFSATLTEAVGKKRLSSYFNYSVYMAFLLISPVAFYIAFLSKQFTYVIFSGLYSIAPEYVAVMAIGILISISSTYATTLVIGAGDTKRVLKYGLAVILTDILLMVPMLLLFGGLGLSLIVFITEPIIANILYLRILRDKMGISLEIGRLLKVALAALVSTVLVVPISTLLGTNYVLSLVISGMVMIILYPPIVSLLGGVRRKDIADLRIITQDLPIINLIVDVFCAYMIVVAKKAGVY